MLKYHIFVFCSKLKNNKTVDYLVSLFNSLIEESVLYFAIYKVPLMNELNGKKCMDTKVWTVMKN